jgi:hypothetical protein
MRTAAEIAAELERYADEVHEMKDGVFISSRMREAAESLRAQRGIGFALVLIKKFQELSSASVPGSFEFNARGKQWVNEAYDYAAALAASKEACNFSRARRLHERAMKYRNKPVVIEAMQLTSNDAIVAAIEWCGGHPWMVGMEPGVQIKTLEGTMYAGPGDWIIKGVKGEFYPIKDEIFKQTYEATNDAT